MKKKILFFSLILAASVCSFNSCDLIEDAIDEVQDAIDDYQNDQDPEFKDNGLTVTLSYKQSGLGYYYEAKFQAEPDTAVFDTVCTSFILKSSFLLPGLAEEAYRQAVESNKDADSVDVVPVTYDNDKIVTFDFTRQHYGLPKAAVVLELKGNMEAYYRAKEAIKNDSIK